MRDLFAGAIAADEPGADAQEVAELLLALTRGLEADVSDADAVLRRLHQGVTLVVAGLHHTHPEQEETR